VSEELDCTRFEEMATTSPHAGTKGYTNGVPGEPVYEAPRRAHRAHHCADFLLRVLTALASTAAIVTILKSNQSVYGVNGRLVARARWNDFAGFKWFLLANAVVCAYAILAAIASLLGVCTRRGPLSITPIAWLTFLVDFLLTNALMSAAAVATTLAWIGYKGQSNAGWESSCGVVRGFCHRIGGALIASYAAWVFLALSTIVAASALHKLRRHHAY
jgi:uncharacterized protein (TIGR01569 family)